MFDPSHHADRGHDDWFDYLLDDLLPGVGFLAMMKAYFDESEQGPVFGISGYIVAAPQVRKFNREWKRHLDAAGVPYFHMKECAHREEGSPFEHMTEPTRKTLLDGLTTASLERTEASIVALISPGEFNKVTTSEWRRAHGNAYTFVARFCLEVVRYWADESNYSGRIAYIFESGGGAGPAWTPVVHDATTVEPWRRKYRVSTCTFGDKHDHRPLQAADLLAYEATKYFTDTFMVLGEKRKPRYPFTRLIGTNPRCMTYWLEGYSLRCAIEMLNSHDLFSTLKKEVARLRRELKGQESR